MERLQCQLAEISSSRTRGDQTGLYHTSKQVNLATLRQVQTYMYVKYEIFNTKGAL